MKTGWVIALLLVQVMLFAAEPADIKVPAPLPVLSQPPRAWLGLQVGKPDPSIVASVPSLPAGVGFVIRVVNVGGPAQAAGLHESDLLWKLGDQMLVNEGQLAVLLRMKKPGEEITLAGFRNGKPLEVKLKLGETPALKPPFPGELVDSAILPSDCGSPMRVINVAERLATYATSEGRVVVRLDGPLYKVKIQGPKEELVYEGELPADGSLNAIPEAWQRRVHALRRGLDHALDGRMMPSRQPRPRVVPSSAQND